MKDNTSTAGAVSAGTGSDEGPATADRRLTEFCEQLSGILVNAGRNRADCIVPKSGPVISFAEWTERAIRSHPDVFVAIAKEIDQCRSR